MGSKIEWLNFIPELKGEKWNPMTGCVKISEGCRNCYAERILERFKMSCVKFRNGFSPTFHEDVLEEPGRWKKPRMVFVNSMSDLFADHWTDDQILSVLQVVNENPQHFFMLLTKRPSRMRMLFWRYKWLPLMENVGIGVSVESSKIDIMGEPSRITHLVATPTAGIKFISYEPLLEYLHPVSNKGGIDWLLVGEESGQGRRHLPEEDLYNFISSYESMPLSERPHLFVKQVFRNGKKVPMPEINGRVWDMVPRDKILSRLKNGK